MLPLFFIDEFFPVSPKTFLDIFGEDMINCKELLGLKYRYELVRDVLFYIFWPSRVSVKKKAALNFLTDPHE